jgi:hypothetical protein
MSKRPIPVAGAIVTAVLVLLFGNPPFVDWIRDPSNVDPNSPIGFLLYQLTWPQWKFTPEGDTNAFIAYELRAVLIIGLVFAILASLAKGVGSFGVGVLVGWVALILGAAVASFIVFFIRDIGSPPDGTSLNALATGGTYGLFVGWIVGIFTGIAKR